MTNEHTHRNIRLQALDVILPVLDRNSLPLVKLERTRAIEVRNDAVHRIPGWLVHQQPASIPRGTLKSSRQIHRSTNGRKIANRSASKAAERNRPRRNSNPKIEKAQILAARVNPTPP